jgi:hypothetical protein
MPIQQQVNNPHAPGTYHYLAAYQSVIESFQSWFYYRFPCGGVQFLRAHLFER